MSSPVEYIKQHYNRFLEDLFTLLRIPSISTQPEHVPDMQRAAQWLVEHCRALGMTHAEVFETPGHPIVYGEWLGAGNAPTVLVYGHYDVQPAEAADGWVTVDPFEPVVQDGNIIARGSADDKGQLFIHLKVFEAFMKTTGKFPVNLKVVFEGEEEASSLNLAPFISAHQELLQADVAVVSDTSFFAPGVPAIPYGLRGIVTALVEISGPRTDLHSGSHGGAVHNPIHAMSHLIAAMHDEHGRVTIPGFYDKVRVLDDEERAQLAKIPYTEDLWRSETGAPKPWGEADYTLIERTGARPTLDVTSIRGGLLTDGIKNIVPQKASATFTCRLVPHQDPEEIYRLLVQHMQANVPDTVRLSVRKHSASPAAIVDFRTPMMQVAIEAYVQVCGVEPMFVLGGGSIPVVTDFQEILHIPTLLLGFGLSDDNLHAPNEKFAVEQFQVGLETMTVFYDLIAQRMA